MPIPLIYHKSMKITLAAHAYWKAAGREWAELDAHMGGITGEGPSTTDDRTVVDYTTPRAVYSGFGFGYFRLTGEDRLAMTQHIVEIDQLYKRLREPVTPLLKDGGRRAAIGP